MDQVLIARPLRAVRGEGGPPVPPGVLQRDRRAAARLQGHGQRVQAHHGAAKLRTETLLEASANRISFLGKNCASVGLTLP